MKILFTLIKFRNLYRVFKSLLSEISTAATVQLKINVDSKMNKMKVKIDLEMSGMRAFWNEDDTTNNQTTRPAKFWR
jgi:hypothetical protein